MCYTSGIPGFLNLSGTGEVQVQVIREIEEFRVRQINNSKKFDFSLLITFNQWSQKNKNSHIYWKYIYSYFCIVQMATVTRNFHSENPFCDFFYPKIAILDEILTRLVVFFPIHPLPFPLCPYHVIDSVFWQNIALTVIIVP